MGEGQRNRDELVVEGLLGDQFLFLFLREDARRCYRTPAGFQEQDIER